MVVEFGLEGRDSTRRVTRRAEWGAVAVAVASPIAMALS